MELIKEFKGKCRAQNYDYKVYRIGDEIILESYQDNEMIDRVTWDYNKLNLNLVLAACDTIEQRG